MANPIETPLYFVRSGVASVLGKQATGLGHSGDYWSSMADTSINNAYNFLFNQAVNPSYPSLRYNTGLPLRCLAS